MPTTQTSMRIPPLRNSSLDTVIQQWLLADGLRSPLRAADTTNGSYSEALPSAGVTGNSGETNQNTEITFVKVSADANSFTITGAVSGPVVLAAQWNTAKFKSDGTNWYRVG